MTASSTGSPDTPPSLAALGLEELVGCSVETARVRVESAGGQLRAARRDQPLTMDYRPDRVTLIVEDDVVVSVVGIG
jgi:hypothetical protein